MRWKPCVKLCPGQRAGQARSCAALTGTYRKGGGASGVPAEVSRHQQPTLPSEIIHHSSHQGRAFTRHKLGCSLSCSSRQRLQVGSLLSGTPAAKAPSPPMFHPRVLLNQGRETEDNLHAFLLPTSCPCTLHSQPALGLVSSSRPAVGLECSSSSPWRPRSTGGAALNLPFLAKHHCRFPSTALRKQGDC